MERHLEVLVESTIVFLPRLVAGAGILLAAWIGTVVGDAIVGRLGRRSRIDPSILHLLQRSGRIALLAFGTVTALGTVSIDVSALVAGLGLTGFALGFALKDVLSNTLAGVLILLYRPFVRADRVAVVGYEGTVTEIDLRYTTLEQGQHAVPDPELHPVHERHQRHPPRGAAGRGRSRRRVMKMPGNRRAACGEAMTTIVVAAPYEGVRRGRESVQATRPARSRGRSTPSPIRQPSRAFDASHAHRAVQRRVRRARRPGSS